MFERTDDPVRDAENYYNAMQQKESDYDIEMQVTLHLSVSAVNQENAKEKVRELLSFQVGQELELLDIDYDQYQIACVN